MRIERTLYEARQWVLRNRKMGVNCPCCGQLAKIYKRRVNAGMAKALIVMYRHAGKDWFYLPEISKQWNSRDEAGLRYWGLIEETQEKREDGGRAGWWRVTDRGELFVQGDFPIPKYVDIYNNHVLGHDQSELVKISDCLGKKFDYDELMAS